MCLSCVCACVNVLLIMSPEDGVDAVDGHGCSHALGCIGMFCQTVETLQQRLGVDGTLLLLL